MQGALAAALWVLHPGCSSSGTDERPPVAAPAPDDARRAPEPGDGTGGGEGRRVRQRTAHPAEVALRFTDGGQRRLSSEDFAALRPVTILSEGQVARRGWSLRELAASVGAARATAVVGDDGARVEIAAETWNAANRLPLLRQNRRGMLKFQWIIDGKVGADDQIRGVAIVELAR